MRGDPKPRNACAAYFVQKRARAVMLSRAEFDAYYERAAFADGPFVGAVDQRRYAHYPPRGQAFGMLNDGTGVYCELSNPDGSV